MYVCFRHLFVNNALWWSEGSVISVYYLSSASVSSSSDVIQEWTKCGAV